MTGTRAMLLLVCAGITPSAALRISKADFPRFAGSLVCGQTGESCPEAAQGFLQHGLAGEGDMADPASTSSDKGGRLVLGFPEGKAFAWSKYSLDFPSTRGKWVVLNQLSPGDQNHVFLSLWKADRDSLEFVKLLPRVLTLALGEMYVHAKAPLPDGSLLLVLKGEGGDAGVNLQDYRVLRLLSEGRVEELDRRANRSEIPVQDILERLNNDQPVEPVMDSVLACEIVPAGRAAGVSGRPSRNGSPGAPRLRFIKTRSRVLYSKAGPQETPLGRDTVFLDVWKRTGK
jgi:hypothetical protein